jgi:hypothetical protein
MNGAFKAVSEALWLNGDIGGKETRTPWEKLEMLALLVMIAVSMALVLDALLFLLDPEEA